MCHQHAHCVDRILISFVAIRNRCREAQRTEGHHLEPEHGCTRAIRSTTARRSARPSKSSCARNMPSETDTETLKGWHRAIVAGATEVVRPSGQDRPEKLARRARQTKESPIGLLTRNAFKRQYRSYLTHSLRLTPPRSLQKIDDAVNCARHRTELTHFQ